MNQMDALARRVRTLETMLLYVTNTLTRSGHVDMDVAAAVNQSYRDGQQLAASTEPVSDPDPEALADCMTVLAMLIQGDRQRDWSANPVDAWLYGVLMGWECEAPHVHDEVCGGDRRLREVAERHDLRDGGVARMRRYRDLIRALKGDGPVRPGEETTP